MAAMLPLAINIVCDITSCVGTDREGEAAGGREGKAKTPAEGREKDHK